MEKKSPNSRDSGWVIPSEARREILRGGLSLYIHVPYCRTRCDYCAFYSQALGADPPLGIMAAYQARLIQDILHWRSLLEDWPLATVYIGGGTPSVIPASLWPPLLSVLRDWRVTGGEFTLEANPESLTGEHLDIWQEGGVNRLSLGIQSFFPEIRRRIGRGAADYDLDEIRRMLRAYWGGRLNLDWMVGLPPGSRGFDAEEHGAPFLDFDPDHISCYELSLEPGTPLAERMGTGAGEDEMDLAADFLEGRGYRRYEISSFARLGDAGSDQVLPRDRGGSPDQGPYQGRYQGRYQGPYQGRYESRHNLRYWEWLPYLGLGPGAHSLLPRGKGIGHMVCEGSPRDGGSWSYREESALTWKEAVKETLMMGLRLTDGVRTEDFRRRFGSVPREVIPRTSARLEAEGRLRGGASGFSVDGIRRWGLNGKGRRFLNCVLRDIFTEVDSLEGDEP